MDFTCGQVNKQELELSSLIKNFEQLSVTPPAHPSLLHLISPSDQPSSYWAGPTLLKLGDRTGTGVSTWCNCKPVTLWSKLPRRCFPVHYNLYLFNSMIHRCILISSILYSILYNSSYIHIAHCLIQ